MHRAAEFIRAMGLACARPAVFHPQRAGRDLPGKTEEFARFFRADFDRVARLIKIAGIKPE
jgi:hypothetical protein